MKLSGGDIRDVLSVLLQMLLVSLLLVAAAHKTSDTATAMFFKYIEVAYIFLDKV